MAPVLSVLDEGREWTTSPQAVVTALRTATGKMPGSRIVAIGVRPSDPAHWFSKMIDGQAGARCACGCGRYAEQLDRIVPIHKGGEPWARANLQALAAICHKQECGRTAH